jgi:hypothetical protein
VGDWVVADSRVSACIKGTDNDMAFDYSQVALIEDKIIHLKEFSEHDDASPMPRPPSVDFIEASL